MSLTEFDDSPRIPVCIVCSTRFAFRSPLCIACEAEARDKMREFLANSKCTPARYGTEAGVEFAAPASIADLPLFAS